MEIEAPNFRHLALWGQSAFTSTFIFHWEKSSYLRAAWVKAIPVVAADELPCHASLATHFSWSLQGRLAHSAERSARDQGQSRAPRTDGIPANGAR